MTCFVALQVVVCVCVDVREQLLEVVSHRQGLLLLCIFPASVFGSQLSVGVLELHAFATDLAFVAIIILMCVCGSVGLCMSVCPHPHVNVRDNLQKSV